MLGSARFRAQASGSSNSQKVGRWNTQEVARLVIGNEYEALQRTTCKFLSKREVYRARKTSRIL